MDLSTPIYVVNGKESHFGFSAAVAHRPAISVKTQLLGLLLVLLLVLLAMKAVTVSSYWFATAAGYAHPGSHTLLTCFVHVSI